MNRRSLAAVLLGMTALSSWSLAPMASEDEPATVARAYLDAMAYAGAPEEVEFYDPADLKELKVALMRLFDTEETAMGSELLREFIGAGVQRAALRELSPREVAIRFLLNVRMKNPVADGRVEPIAYIGTVFDGEDVAHALFRVRSYILGYPMESVAPITLRRSGGRFRVSLPTEMRVAMEIYPRMSERMGISARPNTSSGAKPISASGQSGHGTERSDTQDQ